MRLRERFIILTTVTLLLMAAFVSSVLAADIPGQTLKTTTQTWVNPVYADIATDYPAAQSMQAMSQPEPVPVASMAALRSVLTQGFANRETSISVIYKGDYTDISSQDNNVLDNLNIQLNSIIEGDDYLKFNLQSRVYSGSGTDGNFQIDFTVAYMTTLEQENYVDEQVNNILANLIAPHMNDHQITPGTG